MTTENPYAAPSAAIDEPVIDVPDTILKKIKYAWVAALFSAGTTLIVAMIAMSGTEILGFSGGGLFIDVALILGLAFGIYKKSRTCAVIMFLYFVASKIMILAEPGRASGVPVALVLIYFFWQGISGTFAYHKLRRQQLALDAERD